MTITKHDALTSLKPNTSWTWVGFDYSKLDWLDSSTKPTETEINNEFLSQFSNLLIKIDFDLTNFKMPFEGMTPQEVQDSMSMLAFGNPFN